MKTHYDPYFNPNNWYDDDNGSEYGYCGTYLSDGNATNEKDDVTCKKCIKKFKQADEEMNFHNKNIIKDFEILINLCKKKSGVKSPIFCFYICREKNGNYFGKAKKPKNPEGQKKKV